MKFEIHNETIDDCFVIEADTIEEVQSECLKETTKRNWKPEDCWSREIKNE